MIQTLHSFCIKEMLLSRLIFPRGSFFAGRARTRKLRSSPRAGQACHAGASTPARLRGRENAQREGVGWRVRWTKVMARHLRVLFCFLSRKVLCYSRQSTYYSQQRCYDLNDPLKYIDFQGSQTHTTKHAKNETMNANISFGGISQ